MVALCLLGLAIAPVAAQESVCARVKIEIKQELTLERQAFDAEMRITNSLPTTPLTEVNVEVRVTDEVGTAVAITTDPNDLTAKFFLRQSQTQNIDNVSGTGQVAAQATAIVNWLLIPAPGAAGNTPFGKRYLIGATLRYKFGNETHVMELNPDAITVKPLPSLTLDYFLTRDVIADDPFTTPIEAPEPYTLGVRVKNSGFAAARQLKINSAQPRIIGNQQGLPINFVILGSYVQDVPATSSLLIDFGNIPASGSKMGRWQMESNLAGTFVDFSATFTHSDELGGALTSLLQATNAHLLVRDVRVDLPGRDVVRDFLAVEGSVYRLYESEGQDNAVTDRSAEAVLTTASGAYQLNLPPSQGFFYVRKPDPFQGQKALGPVLRADAKAMAVENVWLSKTKNPDTQQWEHWFNVFDVNSPGSYNVAFKDLDQVPRPPALQFIPDRVVKENEQISFLVEASSPMGKPVVLSAAPLPTGATFHDQSDGVGVFDWTPEVGQAGSYLVNYLASDGTLSASRSAKIRVESLEPPPGPAIPQIVAPLPGAEIASLRPQFQVLTGEASNDPTVSVQFELYADAGFTEKLGEAVVAENTTAGQPTTWTPGQDLNDNTHYYWRARGVAAGVNSEWTNGAFFANLFNDAPESFNLTAPAAGIDVDSLTPVLSATNAVDRDGDTVTYGFEVYTDSTLTERHDGVSDMPVDTGGTTQWTVAIPLTNNATYYWRGIATDEHGAQTQTPARSFRVSTGNQAPTEPTIVSPAPGSDVTTPGAALLRVNNATDADGDVMRYVFEIDTVNTFDSSNRQSSGAIPADSSGITGWQVTGLTENEHYYWRAKASDGRADSGWVVGDFVLDASNDAPTTPVVANPGDRAWAATLTPMFEVHPSIDPEDDEVHYRFEVYRDAALTNLVASGTSNTGTWQPTTSLVDKTTHYWRVRAEDASNNASAWSTTSVLFVSTGTYVAPILYMSGLGNARDARDGDLNIRWMGTGYYSIEPTVALYYDQIGSGFAGTKIIDGIQDVGWMGSYVWDLAGLSAGVYYVYSVIYDDKGLSRSYASGSLVVPTNPQQGVLQTTASPSLDLREGTDIGHISVVLGRAPTKDVVISVTSNDSSEAYVQTSLFNHVTASGELRFTPDNWSTPQPIKVIAVKDNSVDGDQSFAVTLGKAVSLDPDYNGLPAQSFSGVVRDQDTSSGVGLSVSDYILTRKEQQQDGQWDYHYKVVLSNNGRAIFWAIGTALSAQGFTIVAPQIYFGSTEQNGVTVSASELILRSTSDVTIERPEVVWQLEPSSL
ncbi:hypothetical protein [Pseudoxanthomonas sacheonensis]|uniref:Calx-beta domain-containing protein n=1 Tax=Pseudoxanthomonas sacheonensis TaxID=443615 RepID=A0ABU1RQT5_9GAMM|nr:hypothetical protein [Pseudoxanthomonas sacheonensis]MDR6841141.1 hypothetical protein [Pseudoxanthomonas sacheonensis]